MNPKLFYDTLIENQIDFFTGVPDSLLKNICAYITDHAQNHIIAANEGGAIGIASGYHLASKKIPLVYMQNSGLGNAVNPLTSLTDPEVYSIPLVLLVGWRGEPGVPDEPQHVKKGRITKQLLENLEIPYIVLTEDNALKSIQDAVKYCQENSAPYALLVKKGYFDSYTQKETTQNSFTLSRESAIECILNQTKNDTVVSTTGKASREIFEIRKIHNQGHQRDFLTVGSMGHASQIALGIANQKKNRTIFCIDGDGAAIMHLGSLALIGEQQPKNYVHIILNNGAHDSVGGQPTVGFAIDFTAIAKACNYQFTKKVNSVDDLQRALLVAKENHGPSLIEVCIAKGARKDLGRPTIKPKENKLDFMNHLQ